MKVICLMAMLFLLSGCTKPVWETVEDEVPVTAVVGWQESAYEIQLGVPDGLELLEETGDRTWYGGEQSLLEVETSRFLAADWQGAVEALTGVPAEQLTVLQTSRFDLPEYQVAWIAATEEGIRLYRANLVMDDMTCYAVVCSRPEEAGTGLDQEISQVFSTFGLYVEEGV